MVEVGQVLVGATFSEPMRVVTVRAEGAKTWTLGLVGEHTERYTSATLTAADIAGLKILDPSPSFSGDGHPLRLGRRNPDPRATYYRMKARLASALSLDGGN